MSLNHLTDRQIQLYLDGVRSDENSRVEEHVQQCEECRDLVQAYRAVYEEFQSEPGDIFSLAFEDKILKNLAPQMNRSFQFRRNMLLTAGFIFGFLLPTGYVLTILFHSYFSRILNQTWLDIRTTYFIGLNLLEKLHINIEYLIPAGIIILFFSLFEKIILLPKHKKPFLFNTF